MGVLSFLNQWPLWLLIHSILCTTEMIEFWLLIWAKIDFQSCKGKQRSGSRGTTGQTPASCKMRLPEVSSGSNLTGLSCLQAFRALGWWGGDEELPAASPLLRSGWGPASSPRTELLPSAVPHPSLNLFTAHPCWSHWPFIWSPCKWNYSLSFHQSNPGLCCRMCSLILW